MEFHPQIGAMPETVRAVEVFAPQPNRHAEHRGPDRRPAPSQPTASVNGRMQRAATRCEPPATSRRNRSGSSEGHQSHAGQPSGPPRLAEVEPHNQSLVYPIVSTIFECEILASIGNISFPFGMRFCILGAEAPETVPCSSPSRPGSWVTRAFPRASSSKLLAAAGETLAGIDAIFLTHEHGDHTAGIEGLKKFPQILLFANAATAKAVQEGLGLISRCGRSSKPARPSGFATWRSAASPCPTTRTNPSVFGSPPAKTGTCFPRAGAWPGSPTSATPRPTSTSSYLRLHVLAIEESLRGGILQADVRLPWSLKRRISGRHGHLSNDAVRTRPPPWPAPVGAGSTSRIDLSRDCNSPEAVQTAPTAQRCTLACEFSVVHAGEGSRAFEW